LRKAAGGAGQGPGDRPGWKRSPEKRQTAPRSKKKGHAKILLNRRKGEGGSPQKANRPRLAGRVDHGSG